MKQKNKEILAGYAFSLPCIIGSLVFFGIPYIKSLYYCFTLGVGTTKFVGFKNFRELFNSSAFILATKNTVIFFIFGVPLIMIFSLFFAMLLNKSFKYVDTIKTLFVLPLVIPVASIIMVWKIIFDEYGVLNNILVNLDINPINWLNSKYAMIILIMTFIWKYCGYNLILYIAGLNNIPKEYYEYAKIEGASKYNCFTKITLPFLIPTSFFVLVISIVNGFKIFREAYLLAGDYPNESIYLLQHFMNNNFRNLNYQRLSTAAFIIVTLILVIVYFLYTFERKYVDN